MSKETLNEFSKHVYNMRPYDRTEVYLREELGKTFKTMDIQDTISLYGEPKHFFIKFHKCILRNDRTQNIPVRTVKVNTLVEAYSFVLDFENKMSIKNFKSRTPWMRNLQINSIKISIVPIVVGGTKRNNYHISNKLWAIRPVFMKHYNRCDFE